MTPEAAVTGGMSSEEGSVHRVIAPLPPLLPGSGIVVREPEHGEPGYWAGCPAVCYEPGRQRFLLSYRERRPRGVTPDRGWRCVKMSRGRPEPLGANELQGGRCRSLMLVGSCRSVLAVGTGRRRRQLVGVVLGQRRRLTCVLYRFRPGQ